MRKQNKAEASKLHKLQVHAANLGVLDPVLAKTWKLFYHLDLLASLPESKPFASLFRDKAYLDTTVLSTALIQITQNVQQTSRFLPGVRQIEQEAAKRRITIEAMEGENEVEKQKLEALLYFWDFLNIPLDQIPWEASWPNNTFGGQLGAAEGFWAK